MSINLLVAQHVSQHRKPVTSTGTPLCHANFALLIGLKHGTALKQHFVSIRKRRMPNVLFAQNFSEIETGVMHTRARFIANVPLLVFQLDVPQLERRAKES
jgi:hypothetical protein